MSVPDCPRCLLARDGHVLLLVSVVPNAKRTAVDGLHDGALRVRLAAPPIDGRANEALVAWLAKSLGVPRREVRLLRGESARRKQLEIDVAPAAAAAWLARVLDDAAT
jgi:uncharacterized protein (TIGR00251 family)